MRPAKGALELKTTECSAENAGMNKDTHGMGAAVNTERSPAARHLRTTKTDVVFLLRDDVELNMAGSLTASLLT